MKKLHAVALVLGIVLLAGCVTPPSLHTPRPLSPGDVELGVHMSGLLPPRFVSDDTETVEAPWDLTIIPNPTLAIRFGVVNQLELGAVAGALGTHGVIKYGLMPHESPFQASLLGGIGVWGGLLTLIPEVGSELSFPTYDLGFLVGYDLNESLMVYGGARHYWYDVTRLFDNTRPLTFVNAIAGVEIAPGGRFSFPIEANFTVINAVDTLFRIIEGIDGAETGDPDDVPEDIYIIWPMINAGFRIHF